MRYNQSICGMMLWWALVAITTATAESEWVPHQHPASIKRTITGFTRPARFMTVASEYDGRISTILYDAGDTIPGEYGQSVPVAKIDDTFAHIEWQQAKASLHTAHQQVKLGEARRAQSERETVYRQEEVERITKLADDGKVRRSDLDAAVFAADSTRLQENVDTATLDVTHAQILELETKAAYTEERLRRHTIAAPGGWTVLERHAEPGTIVAPGTPLLELADATELAIFLQLSEPEMTSVKRGNEIPLDFPHQQLPSFTARVHRVGIDHNPETNKREIELRVAGDPRISGGMEVRIILKTSDPGRGVMIPRHFITTQLEQNFVTLESGKRLAVLPLRYEGDMVIVASDNIPQNARIVMRKEPPESDRHESVHSF